jgi:dihydroorotase
LIPDLKYHSTKNRSGPKALLNAVDNTIDMITSDHNPMDIEHKKMEFMAKDGTIGLESAYGALMTVLPLEKVIEKTDVR